MHARAAIIFMIEIWGKGLLENAPCMHCNTMCVENLELRPTIILIIVYPKNASPPFP